jgi:hypothetical protein
MIYFAVGEIKKRPPVGIYGQALKKSLSVNQSVRWLGQVAYLG